MIIKVWVDGSCINATKTGGWGVFVPSHLSLKEPQDDYPFKHTPPKYYWGKLEEEATSHRAELKAIHQALMLLPNDVELQIHSDSRWAVNVVLGAFKVRTRLDLVRAIRCAMRKRSGPVSFKLVRGHGNDVNNRIADSLAYTGATS